MRRSGMVVPDDIVVDVKAAPDSSSRPSSSVAGSPGLPLLMKAPARTRSTQHPRACVSHAVDSKESRTINVRQYTNAYIYIYIYIYG
jgi:hypothetical protein